MILNFYGEIKADEQLAIKSVIFSNQQKTFSLHARLHFSVSKEKNQ